MIAIEAIDHFVLVVRDIPRSCGFYKRVLGMTAKELRPGRWALHFGSQKINLQQLGSSVDPNAKHPTTGAGDFCLLTLTPIEKVIAHLAACAVPMIDGPVERSGATGHLRSIYFYDPDENLVEVANLVG